MSHWRCEHFKLLFYISGEPIDKNVSCKLEYSESSRYPLLPNDHCYNL